MSFDNSEVREHGMHPGNLLLGVHRQIDRKRAAELRIFASSGKSVRRVVRANGQITC
jgi:hypothetical protein